MSVVFLFLVSSFVFWYFVYIVLRQKSSKIRKPMAYNPVFIALKKYKSINIFRTNDKIVIACYSYNMDIFSSFWYFVVIFLA